MSDSKQVSEQARKAGRNRRYARYLAALTLGMFAFGFALIPLYDVFCEITGLNGKTGRVEAAALDQQVDQTRDITVQFIKSVRAYESSGSRCVRTRTSRRLRAPLCDRSAHAHFSKQSA